MKKIVKKILRYVLVSIFVIVFLFSTNIESKADWGGSSSLDRYEQVDTEMRAVWVATVGNLNIAPQTGRGDAAIQNWKNYYLEILDTAEASNLNTIIFQIRPANDAFYPSKYNPWSTYLIADGTDPGWDPLKWMIEVTHERGMEYHAWLNPYRASVGTLSMNLTEKDPVTGIEKITDLDQTELNEYKTSYYSSLRDRNPGIDNPVLLSGEELHYNVVLGSEGKFILNPASEKVRTHINNTISEIVDNYDIDGIHFDDYFYPNDAGYAGTNETYKGKTYSSEPYYDQFDYNNYLLECANSGIDAMNVYDWRRENVNTLIKGLGEIIRTKNESKDVKCAFGISPAARWAPTVQACSSEPYRGAEGGMSGSCNNYYSYSDLFADTYKWAKEGWIDYIVPQNYTNLKGDYGAIMKWWSDALTGYPVKLYVGTALYQVSNSWGDSGVLEMYYQLRYNQTKDFRIDGYFLFSYSSMTEKMGANAMKPIAQYAWKYSVLTPLYEAYTYEKKVKEKSVVESVSFGEENQITVDYTKAEGAKGYGVYKALKGESVEFTLSNLVTRQINPSKDMTFKVEDGYDYYLVTFDNDNTIYSDYQKINLESKEPIFTVKLDKEEYYSGEELSLDIEVSDEDDSSHNVSIMYAPDGQTFINTVYYGEVAGTKNIKYQLPKFHTTNGALRVIVNDQINSVTEIIEVKIKFAKPTVSVNFDKEAYSIGDVVTMTLNISDEDSSKFNVSIMYASDGQNYTNTVLSDANDVTKDPYQVMFVLSEVSSESKVKLIISDGLNTIEQVVNVNYKNEAPVVSLGNISNSEVGKKVTVAINATDNENDSLTYNVYISYDGTNYTSVTSGNITDEFALTEVELTDSSSSAIIKVVVSDRTNEVVTLSNSFSITGSSKKGCGCGKDVVMFEVLAIITLLAFVLRKRER